MRQAIAMIENTPATFVSTEWREIPGKGRGVVAARDIASGELIEYSPVLPVPHEQIVDTHLEDYAYLWNESHCAIPMGLAMLYNHSDHPNAKMTCHYNEQAISITALRPIRAGEEICWDYGIELWFEPAA